MIVKSIILTGFLILGICTSCYPEKMSAVSEDLNKDSVLYEYIPDVTYAYMDSAIKGLENEVPLVFNERVKSFVDYFTITNRDYTRMVAERSTLYFPLFEEKLRQYNMPDEIKYLSIIESGLNPRAISRAGAVGLWQFMPATGRYYGLKNSFYTDDRMDPEKSTDAACRYLKALYGMFDNWELAIAAYNCGPGNVRKAVRRSGYKKTFWEIYYYLPRETRGYLPQLVAMIYTMNNLEKHHFFDIHHEYPQRMDTIMVREFTNLRILADQLDLCPEDIRKINPSIVHLALPKSADWITVLIPEDVKPLLNTKRDSILLACDYGQEQLEYLARNTPGSTWGRTRIYYRVQSGDVLGLIAQRYNVRVSDLRAWNNINGNLIRAGQRLSIWVPDGSADNYIVQSKNEVARVTKPVRMTDGSLIYTVMPGDTLWEISKRYEGVTIEKIREWNNLSNDRITPGQKLKIG